jgi:hypothetical protein
MRILTWNMGYWGHSKAHAVAWQWLLDELRPDIAMLQECVPPGWAEQRGTLRFAPAFPDNKRQRWGTALFSRVPSTPAELPEVANWLEDIQRTDVICSAARLSGWCVTAGATLDPDSETLLISLHNPFFPIAGQLLVGRDVSAMRLNLNKGRVCWSAATSTTGDCLTSPGQEATRSSSTDSRPKASLVCIGGSTRPTNRRSSIRGHESTNSTTSMLILAWQTESPPASWCLTRRSQTSAITRRLSLNCARRQINDLSHNGLPQPMSDGSVPR